MCEQFCTLTYYNSLISSTEKRTSVLSELYYFKAEPWGNVCVFDMQLNSHWWHAALHPPAQPAVHVFRNRMVPFLKHKSAHSFFFSLFYFEGEQKSATKQMTKDHSEGTFT